MKEYYPCPVCFLKGRVRTGLVKEDQYGQMYLITEKDVTDNRLWYKCKCGAILETREKVEK